MPPLASVGSTSSLARLVSKCRALAAIAGAATRLLGEMSASAEVAARLRPPPGLVGKGGMSACRR